MTKDTVSRGCLLPPIFSTVGFKQLGLMLSGVPAMCNFWFPEGGKKRFLRLFSIMGTLRGQTLPNFFSAVSSYEERGDS